MSTLFPPPPAVLLPIQGSPLQFPVRRVFCIGRNYAAHAQEMGMAVDKATQPPCYFTKSAQHVVGHGQCVPFPPGTQNLHHEVELVVALNQPLCQVTPEQASTAIFGYAVGLDLTRRDLQAAAKAQGLPWDSAKDFENAAVVGTIVPVEQAGNVASAGISLTVNGQLRQQGNTADLIWSIGEVLAYLSTLHHLQAGDLVFTGTPEGVAALQPGDTLRACVDGLPPLDFSLRSGDCA